MLRIHPLISNQSEFIQRIYKSVRIKNYGEKNDLADATVLYSFRQNRNCGIAIRFGRGGGGWLGCVHRYSSSL